MSSMSCEGNKIEKYYYNDNKYILLTFYAINQEKVINKYYTYWELIGA